MFLLVKVPSTHTDALEKLRSRFSAFTPGGVHTILLGNYSLGWFSVKPTDNLHVFSDGIFIGKLHIEEPANRTPIQHGSPLPKAEIHPLSQGAIISLHDEQITIEPWGITNIYYDTAEGTVSDSQLLIADLHRHLPSPLHVAIMATAGYAPANLTLFEPIRKIPFLFRLVLPRRTLEQHMPFTYRQNNDEAMLTRLKALIPTHISASSVAMTGGYDSRFVTGLLLAAGLKPQLLHFSDPEDDLVREFAHRTHLPVKILPMEEHPLTAEQYTLMTDGLIYCQGGKFGRFSGHVRTDSIFLSGLFASSILKSGLKAAWMTPSSSPDLFEHMVGNILLGGTPAEIHGLREVMVKAEIVRYLLDEYAYARQYHDFPNKKEWSCWFYFLNRGLRWSNTVLADIGFYCTPLLVLGDYEATTFGLSSSTRANLAFDRVRKLNNLLFPSLNLLYADGQPFRVSGGPLRIIGQYRHEYLRGFLNLLDKKKHQSSLKTKTAAVITDEMCCPDLGEEPPGFDRVFSTSMSELLSGSAYTHGLKRAAITTFYVLKYLAAD